MVHQEQITTIIMLCKTIEDGKPKCFQYWPAVNGENRTYGCMFVMNKRVCHISLKFLSLADIDIVISLNTDIVIHLRKDKLVVNDLIKYLIVLRGVILIEKIFLILIIYI